MKTKLSNLNSKEVFVAQGHFFAVYTEFLTIPRNTFTIHDSFITRISRFNQEDFQKDLIKRFPKSRFILFSKDIFYKKNYEVKFDYIPQKFDFTNFAILNKILNQKRIILVDVNYQYVHIYQYENKKVRRIYEKELNIVNYDNNTSKLNNVLFDPVVSKAYLNDFADIWGNIKKISHNTVIIFTGEYVWSNSKNSLLNALLYYKIFDNIHVIIDEFGIYKALLSVSAIKTNLRLLDRSFFVYDFILTGKNPSSVVGEIYSFKPSKYGKLDLDVFKAKDGRKITFKDSPLLPVDTIVQVKGKANVKHVDFGDLTKDIKAKPRSDLRVEICNVNRGKLQFEYIDQVALQIFDYTRVDRMQDVTLDIVNKEHISKGDRLCKYREFGSLLEKKFFSPISGRVDLDKFNFGFIFVNKKSQKYSFSYSSMIKIRPVFSVGKNVIGLLNKNIRYVTNLDKEKFQKYVQNGAVAIIARTITTELFFQILEFSLYNLCTIVILDGISLNILKDNHILTQLSDNIACQILPDKNIIQLYGDFKKSVICLDKTTCHFYKTNDKVRIIHEKYWGEEAYFVNKSINTVAINHVKLSKIHILNLD